MDIIYIVKTKDNDGSMQILDVCTNRKIVYKNVKSLLKETDDILFSDNPLFDMLPKYKFNYYNLVKTLAQLNHRQSVEVDIYRFVDEFEKLHAMTVSIQKWSVNDILKSAGR